MNDKLTENLVIRVSKSMKLAVDALAEAYRTDSADLVRRLLTQALAQGYVPGYTKLKSPPKWTPPTHI